MARQERQLHMQLYPQWSARDNYGYGAKKKKRKKEKTSDGGIFVHLSNIFSQNLKTNDGHPIGKVFSQPYSSSYLYKKSIKLTT